MPPISGARFPKRLAPGARPVQEQPPQPATLFVRRYRGSRVRDRIGQCSPSNQSLTSASQGSCRDLPGKRSGPRGSRIGHHRLRSSRHTRGPWSPTDPVNPETAGFRNPRQLSTFTDSCAEPKSLTWQRKGPGLVREERAGSPGVATVLVVGAVGIETITLLETKEFCGAARSSM